MVLGSVGLVCVAGRPGVGVVSGRLWLEGLGGLGCPGFGSVGVGGLGFE